MSYKDMMPSPGIDENTLYMVTSSREDSDKPFVWIVPVAYDGREYGATEENLRHATKAEKLLYKILFLKDVFTE